LTKLLTRRNKRAQGPCRNLPPAYGPRGGAGTGAAGNSSEEVKTEMWGRKHGLAIALMIAMVWVAASAAPAAIGKSSGMKMGSIKPEPGKAGVVRSNAAAARARLPGKSIEQMFMRAQQDFRQGKKEAAAKELREAANLLRKQATHMPQADRAAVNASAGELDAMARGINRVNEKQLRQAFARAHLSLARYHQRAAKAASKKKDARMAQMQLMAGQAHQRRAAMWAGEKPAAQPAPKPAPARGKPSLGKQISKAATAAAHNTDAEIDRLGEQIERLGHKIGKALK
jgi:hypothetical protein